MLLNNLLTKLGDIFYTFSVKKALVISGTSKIGQSIIEKLVSDNCFVYVTGRKIDVLRQIKEKYPQSVKIIVLDITKNPLNILSVDNEIYDGLDFVLICAGTGDINMDFDLEKDNNMIDVNVKGCSQLLLHFVKFFHEKKQGHIAVITSIAGIMSGADAPCYYASKAFLSNYICGLRLQLKKKKSKVVLTDIKPGLVDTPMAKGDGLFWVQPVEKVADQIYLKLKKQKKTIVVTKRWKLLYFLYKLFFRF